MDLGELCQLHSIYDTPTSADSEGAIQNSYILSFKEQFPDLVGDRGWGKISHIHTHTTKLSLA